MSHKAFVSQPATSLLSELGAKLGSTGYFARTSIASKGVQHERCYGKVRNAHHDASQKKHERRPRSIDLRAEMPGAKTVSDSSTTLAHKLLSTGNASTRRENLTTNVSEIESEIANEETVSDGDKATPVEKLLSSGKPSTAESDIDKGQRNFEGFLWRTRSTRLLNAAPELPIQLTPFWDGSVLKAKIVRGENRNDQLRQGYSSAVVPPIWLRDICPCEKCVHPQTLQRMVDIFDLPKDACRIKHCSVFGSDVYITWRDGHESSISFKDLPKLSGFGNWAGRAGLKRPFISFTSSIADAPPTVQYEDVIKTEEGLANWLAQIRHRGFVFVEKVPTDPDATKSLLERIAFIRQTHYGGFWDFTADLSSKDTAYTQEALPLHTDTTYFSDPAGLQLFHLLSHTGGEGGETILVDGFRAAEHIRSQDQFAYKILKNMGVYAHASGNIDSSIQPCKAYPVINDDRSGRVIQIRWNPADRVGIGMAINEIGEWYQAAKLWNDWIKHESNQYRFQLKPGTALIFDNWRVLHARTAFTGKRRMCGGYINRDDFVSRYKMMNWGRWQTLDALGLNPSLKPEDGDENRWKA